MSTETPATLPVERPAAEPRRLGRAVRALNDAVEAITRLVCIGLFTVMIAVVFFEVIMRYGFNAPTFWSEAVARNAMIWLVLLGMAVGIRHQDHIRVDVLVLAAPRMLQVAFAILRYLLALALALVFLVYGWILAADNLRQLAPGLEIPVFYIYLSVPVAAAGMILFLVELVVRRDVRPF